MKQLIVLCLCLAASGQELPSIDKLPLGALDVREAIFADVITYHIDKVQGLLAGRTLNVAVGQLKRPERVLEAIKARFPKVAINFVGKDARAVPTDQPVVAVEGVVKTGTLRVDVACWSNLSESLGPPSRKVYNVRMIDRWKYRVIGTVQ